VPRVRATASGARGGPGLEFDKLGVFAGGSVVEVVYDSPGPWAQVRGVIEGGGEVVAWVSDQFLA
jgi:hypothetical protein